jgi:LCP family protein required for cell wall assembly
MEPGPGDERAAADPSSGSRSDASRREGRQAYRKAHRHPWLRRGSIAMAGGLALLLVVVALGALKLNSNITKLDLSNALGKRPVKSAAADAATNLEPLNFLVMGSDSRDLGTNKFGKASSTPGQRSDTTLLVHLSGDRKSAVVVSVPRDSMTRAPLDCKDPNSEVADGPIRMWNANFSLGGPACVIRTFEGNTDIRVDHFMVLDFMGFQSMVDALGKVEVCLPKAVNDPDSKLHLPAGKSRVSGEQALAFVRVRNNITGGSDLGRINRQQAFLSAMVQEATSSRLLLRPDKLFRLVNAATDALTIDNELSTNAMREVAQSVAGMKPSQVRFVTVPIEDYPPNKARVQWTSAADALWESIKVDVPLPGSKPAPRPKSTVGPKPSPTGPALTIRPDRIIVRISNTTNIDGLARQASEDLRIQGFGVSGTSTGADFVEGVVIGYSSTHLEEARTVAAAFPGAKLVKDASADSEIQVTLGSDSPYVVEVPNRLGTTPLPPRSADGVATPSSTVTIKARTASSDICKQ